MNNIKLALDALKQIVGVSDHDRKMRDEAIQALTQPQAEPVAWWAKGLGGFWLSYKSIPENMRSQVTELFERPALHPTTGAEAESDKITQDVLNRATLEAERRLALRGDPGFEVGDIVETINQSDPLHCGSGIYADAVVIQAEPLILASRSSDMRWSQRKTSGLRVTGKATEEQLAICMRRLKS